MPDAYRTGTPSEQARFAAGWLKPSQAKSTGVAPAQRCHACQYVADSYSGRGLSCVRPQPGRVSGWATVATATCDGWVPAKEVAHG